MAKSEIESGSDVHSVTQRVIELKDGDHLAFTFAGDLELAEVIPAFVDKGLNQNHLNIFLVTRKQAEIYTGYLKDSGIDADKLIASEDILFEPIDELIQEEHVKVITDSLTRKLQSAGALASRKGRRGLNILGEIAGTFAAMGRYEDCVLVEMFWHNTMPTFKPPITLICPYASIPTVLKGPMKELHNSMIPIHAIWEIVPASYTCVKCKKHVKKEIREGEPDLMMSQTEIITISMRENDAGWIPYCFGCISTNPVLKPHWIRV
jgi:hypothetical protein